MVAQLRDRGLHATGIRYPPDWADGTCAYGHDITLETNLGLEAQRGRNHYRLRCLGCRRDSRNLVHVTRLQQRNWATAVKICDYCGLEFRPGARDTTRNSWAVWQKRRYCSTSCSSKGAKKGIHFRHIHADITAPPDGWQDRAACYGADASDFYPDHETAGSRGDIAAHERRIIAAYCDRCPVRRDCLNASLARRDYFGVQGGMRGVDRETYRPPRPPRQVSA
jgi:WhiB family redox-sensing transcriptional regulator